jgi:cardiolipin synthase
VNFDNRSFQLQDEVTLCVCSRDVAAALDAQFQRDLDRSAAFDLERWERRALAARAREAVTKVARREL